jgi:hypothetical protein
VESKSDRDAIVHLLEVLQIGDYEVIEYASLYASLGGPLIAIEEIDNKFNIIAVNGNDSCVEICTQDNLYNTVAAMRNRYQISNVVNLNSYISNELVSYFANAEALMGDRKALIELTVFGFAMTDKAFSLGNIRNLQFSNDEVVEPESIPVMPTQEVETFEDLSIPEEKVEPKKKPQPKQQPKQQPKKQPKPKKEKIGNDEEKQKKKKKKFGLPNGLSMFLILVELILIMGSFIGERYLNNALVNKQLSYNSLSTQYNENVSQVEAYKIVEGTDTQLSSYQVISDIVKCGTPKDVNFTVESSTVEVTGSFSSKKDASKFLKSVSKKYAISSDDVQSSKSKFLCDFTVSLL